MCHHRGREPLPASPDNFAVCYWRRTGKTRRLQRAGRVGHLNKPQVSEICHPQGQDPRATVWNLAGATVDRILQRAGRCHAQCFRTPTWSPAYGLLHGKRTLQTVLETLRSETVADYPVDPKESRSLRRREVGRPRKRKRRFSGGDGRARKEMDTQEGDRQRPRCRLQGCRNGPARG